MNRLILIGNGFDLAHGKKTGYTDFIKWYTFKCLKSELGSDSVSDPLITMKRNGNYLDAISPSDQTLNKWIDAWIDRGGDFSCLGEPKNGWNNSLAYPFIVKVSSDLLIRLLGTFKTYRWVDIEATFYDLLLSILSKGKHNDQEGALQVLNQSMRILSSELENYLQIFQDTERMDQYEEIICDYIHPRDLQSVPMKDLKDVNEAENAVAMKPPDEIWLLDFNYTKTASTYTRNRHGFKIKCINIHGRLSDSDNPIIFGFGDEIDKRYEEIENSRAKGWFEYIKSFWYLKTNNYRDLVSFIDSDQYQVVVLGHSCGLSDRTMLQMIFQHDNCRSIKLYYHGTKDINNHRQTLHEVSRQFKDKGLMRRRIVSEENSERMPQYND